MKESFPPLQQERTLLDAGPTDRTPGEAGSTRHAPDPSKPAVNPSGDAGKASGHARSPSDEARCSSDQARCPPDEARCSSDEARCPPDDANDLAEVSAGFPDDVGDGCVALDAAAVLKAKSRSFALRVRGCSMIGAGIEDGDIVVGEFTPTARAGAVVVALIDGQSTLKRFVTRSGRPCLVSENPNCPDPVAMSELVIQGVVHTVVKRVTVG